MPRPAPEILCTYDSEQRSIDILKTSGVWGITHLGKLVSMRYRHQDVNGQTAKYPKTMFPSRASALNCARRLNTVFETDAFSIARLSADIPEQPPEPDLSNYEQVEPN